MNIAYILHSTAPNAGATKAFLNMLDGLSPYSVHPFVVVPDGKGVTQELKKRQIPTLITNFRSSVYPHCRTMKEKLLFLPRLVARMFVNQRATRAVRDFLRNNRIDIVHSNSGVVRIGFDAARGMGIPHVYHIREYGAFVFGMHYFPNQKAFQRQLRMPDCYTICITKDVQRYQQLGGMASSRVIYDGVFPARTDMPVGTGKDYFLYAGRIEEVKGLDELLLAYKGYVGRTDCPIPLKVAGSVGRLPYYRQQVAFVREQGLAGLVEWLGERDDVALLMRQARALVIPSRNEGFGFCMPEAMQQGCLCIARNTGGTKEQLDNALQMTGEEIALRYDTAEQLTEYLLGVGNHAPEDYAAYTERAFRVVNQLYTKDVHAKRVYEFYQEIIGK